MNKDSSASSPILIHLTNVVGAGAVQLVQSLLPVLERVADGRIKSIFLPELGKLSQYQSYSSITETLIKHRFFPNPLSRLFELLSTFHKNSEPNASLLVLGDIPLRTSLQQTVFVQTPNILKSRKILFTRQELKFIFMRYIFKKNIKYANKFIVQTNFMFESLTEDYPALKDKTYIINQPVPSWLLNSNLRRNCRSLISDSLSLFYPAATYPHKNHKLLGEITTFDHVNWPISELILTVPSNKNPAPNLSWISCVDMLSSNEVLNFYSKVDALLFLSIKESYGFPLIEAMYIGLPIICPDLPYARQLCGDVAIYFDPKKIESLFSAVQTLKTKLSQNWWPNWSRQLKPLPLSWEETAKKFLSVIDLANSPNNNRVI